MQKNNILGKGALLHDIGKILMRADRSLGNHSDAGVKFLKRYVSDIESVKSILECIKYHHGKNLKKANLSDDNLAYIVYEADNISAGIDRRDNDENKNGFDLNVALESVFNVFSSNQTNKIKKRYPLRGMDAKGRFNYPCLTLVDNVQISSQLVTDFLERNIPVSWISSFGRFYGSLLNNKQIDILKHKKQFEALTEKSFYEQMSRKVIFAKVHNQVTILMSNTV